MEKNYSESVETCELVNAQQETVQFLLNFSKSLHVTNHKGITFEGNVN